MSSSHPLPTFEPILTSVVLKQLPADKEQPVKLNWDFGNGARLEHLGKVALDHALELWAFHQSPALSTTDMDTKKNDAFSDDNLRLWENAYDLKSLCNGPGDIEELMDKPEEIRRFFHRLLGALEFKEGFPAVYAWVIRLIDPDGPSSSQPSTSTIKVNHSTPPVSESSTQSFMSSPPRPAPQSGSSSSSNITLAMLNQKASQNQMKVEYPAESTGPPHNPTWAVRCLLDGKEKGFGRAKSQKAAKEAAAQQAWQSMGW